ncbi:MAG: LacI family DNA-binding transcriptional regulator [Chloroflexota bacterium]
MAGDRMMEDGKRPARLTIRDIAARSGVSVATVSRVLNGRPDVSNDTRESVLRLIREHGYATNRNARGLAAGRTGLIGLTVPVVHAEYFNQIVAGAAEALYERDARFVLCPTQNEHDREVSLLERLMHGTTDGAILILPSESGAELLRLRQNGYPFVVVDPETPVGDDIPVVAAAHWAGAKTATDYLIGLGHRHIAAITGPTHWVASSERLSGYRSALSGAGLPIIESLIRESDFRREGGYRAGREVLVHAPRPTAVFCFNDHMAVGALRAAWELCLAVPGDLSIIGFDDVQLASAVSPRLTTIRQPLQEMGSVAVSQLYRLLDGQMIETAHVHLSTRIVVRESTAPPSDHKTLR